MYGWMGGLCGGRKIENNQAILTWLKIKLKYVFIFSLTVFSPLSLYLLKLRAVCETCISKAVECQSLLHSWAQTKSNSVAVKDLISDTVTAILDLY